MFESWAVGHDLILVVVVYSVSTVKDRKPSVKQYYMAQDLRAEVFEGRQVAVEGVSHEVVGKWKMFLDVFYRPRVKVQVQQALVTAVETANLPSELQQLCKCLQARPASCNVR